MSPFSNSRAEANSRALLRMPSATAADPPTSRRRVEVQRHPGLMAVPLTLPRRVTTPALVKAKVHPQRRPAEVPPGSSRFAAGSRAANWTTFSELVAGFPGPPRPIRISSTLHRSQPREKRPRIAPTTASRPRGPPHNTMIMHESDSRRCTSRHAASLDQEDRRTTERRRFLHDRTIRVRKESCVIPEPATRRSPARMRRPASPGARTPTSPDRTL
jgi:hypothetical protein